MPENSFFLSLRTYVSKPLARPQIMVYNHRHLRLNWFECHTKHIRRPVLAMNIDVFILPVAIHKLLIRHAF